MARHFLTLLDLSPTELQAVIERACQKKALLEMQPMQAGDVLETYADITDSCRDLDFQPSTSIEEGIPQFVDWYKSYFDV